MTGSTEVQLTSPRSAGWQKAIAGMSVAGVIAGFAVTLASEPRWWAILLWGVVALVVVFVLVGLWFAAEQDARATQELQRSGVVARADVVHSAEVTDGEEGTRYVLTLEIRPAGHDPFTVTHRCRKDSCAEAAGNLPSTITTLVDAPTRTWAVLHR